ncbi:MAG: hypothetical protein ACXABY_02365 [Candidatus Thorarchaeota archaeon]|jgi:hypothetical protein
MPGGKRRLKQLFVGQMQSGANGTAINKIMTGSVGFATAGCADTQVHNACAVAEVTIANLSPCAMMLGNVEGMSACFRFQGEVIAGDGQASLVYRYSGCGASVDPRTGATGGTLRYIAFDPA